MDRIGWVDCEGDFSCDECFPATSQFYVGIEPLLVTDPTYNKNSVCWRCRRKLVDVPLDDSLDEVAEEALAMH